MGVEMKMKMRCILAAFAFGIVTAEPFRGRASGAKLVDRAQ
jgi:hypothetical protein